MNIKNKDIDQLMDFLLKVDQLEEWEVCKLDFITSLSKKMNVNLASTGFINEFVEFRDIKKDVEEFYLNNKHLSLMLDIKLKLPFYLKDSIDINNECKSFYLNLYSEGDVNLITPTFTERGFKINNSASKHWIIYVLNIYNEYENKIKLNN